MARRLGVKTRHLHPPHRINNINVLGRETVAAILAEAETPPVSQGRVATIASVRMSSSKQPSGL